MIDDLANDSLKLSYYYCCEKKCKQIYEKFSVLSTRIMSRVLFKNLHL